MIVTDVVIVGGGIAGASLAYWLSDRCKAVLLEAEQQPGYHATGRSAALYTTTYGHPIIRGLTLASRGFLDDPPERFADRPLLFPRGVLWIARREQRKSLQTFLTEVAKTDTTVKPCSLADAMASCPVLQPGYVAAAAVEPNACDMDAASLHQGYLRSFKAQGGQVVCDARVERISRQGSGWEIRTRDESYSSRLIVNAAGAWADEVSRLAGVKPVGLTPKRRTAITFDPLDGLDVRAWPCVIDVDEDFYFKPDAGRILASPADETPVRPSDARPEEIDVAVCIDRVERTTTMRVRRVAAKWAGLRTFAPDKLPVVGKEPDVPGFFWLAGQGGYGIMTSPTLGELAADLVLGHELPARFAKFGVDAEALSPRRFRSP